MRELREVFYVDGVRTAFGRAGPKGVFWRTRADDLGVKVVRELLRRNPTVPPERIDDVVLAATAQVGDQGLTLGRDVALLAGLPQTVPGFAVDRMCAGALTAVTAGAGEIAMGAADLVLAGGIEHMGHHPMGEDVDFNPRFVAERLVDTSAVTMGATAENLHDRFPQLTKEDADAYAVRSQRRAAAAWENGVMRETVVPMTVFTDDGWRAADRDEFLRPETTLEALATLPTPFRPGGRVTAGNSAGLTDGATVCLLASEHALAEHSLEPRMRLVSYAFAGVEPELMGLGPVPATEKALERAGLTLDEIGLFELNEPFAVQVLSWCDGLGVDPEDERLNPYGGAIACGHPLAATGVRLLAQLAYGFRERPDALRADRALRRDGHGRRAGLGEPRCRRLSSSSRPWPGPTALASRWSRSTTARTTPSRRSSGARRWSRSSGCCPSWRRAAGTPSSLTGKPFVFAAGADVTQFPGATRELAIAGSRAGHELFGRIRALPYPTLAAINGACLGGGVELALHCDARTISTGVRHFACPECFLGIVPAWGGTQLVPRLVGAETAVKFIVANPLRQNRMLSGPEAFELGFADRLLGPAEFVDESIAFACRLQPSGDSHSDGHSATEVIRKARGRLDGQVHGAAPAPYAALDLIEGALSGWSLEEGYAAEEEAVGDLLPGRQAQASLYAFDLVDRRAKRAPGRPSAAPRPIRKVGLVGAGLMAAQLATLFLRRLELPVALRDVSDEALAQARASIEESLAEQVGKGRYDEGKARFLGSLVSTSRSYEDFADCDLVLEAVFEELEVKQQVFAELREHVRDDCVLATNTSSLSVAAMGADVGIHFFNPVAVLPLVELVRTPATDDETLATAWAFAEGLRKRPVLVADAPAFVVNRVLTRLMSVVLDALERGTDPDDADEAILTLGLPMAPSVLLQMVGPRVANHVLETLHGAYPDRFPLSATLANYADGKDEIVVREQAPLSREQLLEAALDALADEIHHLLAGRRRRRADRTSTPRLLLGAGWPFWLGGITKYLDQTGISERMFGRTFT